MAVKSLNIYNHAKELFDPNCCDELTSRMLINRIYYAAYGHALSEVENKLFYELDEKNPSVHQRLIKCFGNIKSKDANQTKKAAKIANSLRQASIFRKKSDYELNANIHVNDVKQTFLIVEDIINLLEELN
ncbi:hypothetical protein [Acinetobacter nosocomialis]|uniref:hypothetical protein n=1 Tax=Acinetobacter nosocomialis TaxID=106654 RepID=UPI001AE7320D|nr:hypothetical protein [Acinetobacter nosocomialis]MBP1470627.1 hypothetical protein [Acinetobacter nosocomialis]